MQVLASKKTRSGTKYAYIRIVKACHQTTSLYTATAVGYANIKHNFLPYYYIAVLLCYNKW